MFSGQTVYILGPLHLGISGFARKGERKAQGYLGAASAAILRSSRRISELDPAIETGRLPSRSGVVDAIDDIKGLTPHASRLNGTASVATTPVAFYVPLLEHPHYPEMASQIRQDAGARRRP